MTSTSSVGLSTAHISNGCLQEASESTSPSQLQSGDKVYLLQRAINGSLAQIGVSDVEPDRVYHKGIELIEVYDEDGNLIIREKEKTRHHKRGKVSATISPASRRRLLRLCASFDKATIDQKQVLFATLTYGSDDRALSWTWEDYKRHLNNFLTQLRKKYGKTFFGIWRVEWQKRGVGHFHLVLMFVNGFKAYIDKNWLAETWNQVTGGNQDHLKAGTSIERAKNWKETSKYFSKTMAYMAKETDAEIFTSELADKQLGRHWGYINRDILKNHINIKTSGISRQTFSQLRRVFLKYLKRCKERRGTFNARWWQVFKRRICEHDFNLSVFIEDRVVQRLVEVIE